MSPTEMAYRKTAIEGASGFSLLIALYDTLAGDLRRGAEAERANHLEKRCQELNHALLVIAHLEDWLSHASQGFLSQFLSAFYSNLRRKIIEAQAKHSPELLEQQMAMVLKIRGTWQQCEQRGTLPAELPHWAQTPAYPGVEPDRSGRLRWSA
jgi:flagellar biosynthetic protein FliS